MRSQPSHASNVLHLREYDTRATDAARPRPDEALLLAAIAELRASEVALRDIANLMRADATRDQVTSSSKRLRALASALDGSFRGSTTAAPTADTGSANDYDLSPREREVLRWIARGKTNAEIAIILGISRHTVDTHIRRTFVKLETSDRTSAAIKAIREGLLEE